MNIDEFRAMKEQQKLDRHERRRQKFQKKKACDTDGVSKSSVHTRVSKKGVIVENVVKRVLVNHKQMGQCPHKVGVVKDADVINRFLTGGVS